MPQNHDSLSRQNMDAAQAKEEEDVAASAFTEHSLDTGHACQVDLTKAEVIDYHPHTTTQCPLESWHMHCTNEPRHTKKAERHTTCSV